MFEDKWINIIQDKVNKLKQCLHVNSNEIIKVI